MYPTRNTSTYTSPSKNTNSQSNSGQSAFNFLLIDNSNIFLIDDFYKLLIEDIDNNWSYQTKS